MSIFFPSLSIFFFQNSSAPNFPLRNKTSWNTKYIKDFIGILFAYIEYNQINFHTLMSLNGKISRYGHETTLLYFLDAAQSCSKMKKKVAMQYDFRFPSDYEGTELWFQYITARGKCQQMQSQCEWVQSSLGFVVGRSKEARLQRSPTAREGQKHCQLHSTTTPLLLWTAEMLQVLLRSVCKVPAPHLELRTGRSLGHIQL